MAAKEVLPDLVKMLESDKDEYAVRCAASALARLGASARSALPVMRKQAEARGGAVRQALEQAAAAIEKGDKEAAPDDAGTREVIRRQIAEFVKARSAKPSR